MAQKLLTSTSDSSKHKSNHLQKKIPPLDYIFTCEWDDSLKLEVHWLFNALQKDQDIKEISKCNKC